MITKRQSDVLRAIRKHQVTQGHTPSYKEIAQACGLTSLATVSKHIRKLEEGGFLYSHHHNLIRSSRITALGLSVLLGDGQDVKLAADKTLEHFRRELGLELNIDMHGESPLLRIRMLWYLLHQAAIYGDGDSPVKWCNICDQGGSDTIQHKENCILRGMPNG